MLVDAHEQLLLRDQEVDSGGARKGLEELVEERTAWAQRLDAELATRNSMIRELQATVEERTDWAQRLDAELAGRNSMIRELQATVEERTLWAQRLDSELRAAQQTVRAPAVPPLSQLAVGGLRRLLEALERRSR
jgi:chromosome segregation ATPase